MAREDAVLAREWFNASDRRQLQDRYFPLMVEAAVLLVEGRSDDALQKTEESTAVLRQAQYQGYADAASDWLKMISERAQKPSERMEQQVAGS